MNHDAPESFILFSLDEMKTRPEQIRVWAKQTINPLLQSLAREVLEVAGAEK